MYCSLFQRLCSDDVHITSTKVSVTLCDRTGIFYSFDHVADRRRHQVFTQESVASQSLELVAYRTLVVLGVTQEQVKEYGCGDYLNDSGEMFARPS